MQNNTIQKILSSRKNIQGRDSQPYFSFYKKISRTNNLLNNIEKKIKSRYCIQEARKQYITACTTAIEVYFKDKFIEVIKKTGIEKVDSYCTEKYDIKKIREIIKNNITPEELILENINFLYLDNIDNLFSKALGIRFFSELKLKIINIPPLKKFHLPKDFYVVISEMIDLRHNFVHDINFKKNITKKQYKKYFNRCGYFVLAVDIYLLNFKYSPSI